MLRQCELYKMIEYRSENSCAWFLMYEIHFGDLLTTHHIEIRIAKNETFQANENIFKFGNRPIKFNEQRQIFDWYIDWYKILSLCIVFILSMAWKQIFSSIWYHLLLVTITWVVIFTVSRYFGFLVWFLCVEVGSSLFFFLKIVH